MDAIGSYSYCSSKVCVDNQGGSSSRGGKASLRKELSFLRSSNVFGFRVLRLASEALKPLCPASSLSSNAVPGLGTKENEIQETHLSKTVPVRFQLKKQCQFGEQFLLVGDDPMLGSWDPSCAIPMNWSDGNLWTLDLDIPIGRQIHFKFILNGSTGNIQWQPDPDRVLETWETEKTIIVFEDWEDAASQRISEGETLTDSSEEMNEKSEMSIVADNLSPPVEKVILATENGSTLANKETGLDDIPSEEARDKSESHLQNKSASIIADNMTPAIDKLPMDMVGSSQAQKSIGSEEKDRDVLKKEMTEPENTPGNNLKPKAINSASPHNEGGLVTFNEGPVLVPGLTPMSMALEKEPIQVEPETSTDMVTGFEDTDQKEPELKEKRRQEEGTMIVPSDHEKQKEVPQLVRGQENNVKAEDEEEANAADVDNLLRNDIRWGRKALQNFLANLGLSL